MTNLLVTSRLGRIVLHLATACVNKEWGFHAAGIVRELQGD